MKALSAGLSAWVSWSRNFQTPLFLQELSKGDMVPMSGPPGVVCCTPGTRVDSALVRAALQWKRTGNPPLNSVKNGGGNQPLMGFTELSPGSLTVSAASHFTSPAAFCSLPSLQRRLPEGRERKVERREGRVSVGVGRGETEGAPFPAGLMAPEPVFSPHHQAVSPAMDPTGCFSSVQLSSVPQSCRTLCDPMNCSTPGLPVHRQLPEFTQTHVHGVGDAIQPSHPLSSPSPPAPNSSQHQNFFQ